MATIKPIRATVRSPIVRGREWFATAPLMKAINTLRKLTRSPAGIQDANGYLQVPANLLTWSQDFTNAAWVKVNLSGSSATSLSFLATSSACAEQTVAVSGGTSSKVMTFAAMVSTSAGTQDFRIKNTHGGVVDNFSTVMTATTTPQIVVFTVTNSASVGTGSQVVGLYNSVSAPQAGTIVVTAAALFQGTYTASQLQAMGGIPRTMGTASVALSLGPNLVTNGDFSDGATGWAPSASTTISGGVASVNSATAETLLTQDTFTTANKTMFCSVTATVTSGGIYYRLGGVNSVAITTSGTQTFQVASGAVNAFRVTSMAGGFIGTIDNITVQEILSTTCPVYTDAHVWAPGGTVTSYGPELVVNGDFSAGTSGWTDNSTAPSVISVVSGVATGVTNGVAVARLRQPFQTVIGTTYWISGAGTMFSLGSWAIGTTSGGSEIVAFGRTSARSFVATSTTTWFNTASAVNGLTLDNISVKEVITSVNLNSLLTNNYLLSDASTGLAPVDQYVGLVSDALGGLERKTLGAWGSPASGITVSSTASDGVVTFSGAQVQWAGVGFAVTGGVIAGTTYKITATVAISSGSVSVNVGAGNVINMTTGVTSFFCTAANTNTGYASCNNAGITGTISNIIVEKVTGIHATQATTASKPKLVRGAVNLLMYSGDFTNAAWSQVATGVKTPNFSTLQDGTFGGCRLVTTALAGGVRNYVTAPAGPATSAAWVKSNTGSDQQFTIRVFNGSAAFTAGTLIATSSWQLFVLPVTAISGYQHDIQSVAGQPSVDLLLGSQAVFQGTYTAAQIKALGGLPLTTTAPASTALGPWAWQFDGVNDSLALSSVPFQMSDDHYVCAAFDLASVASNQAVFGGATSPGTANPVVCSMGFNTTSGGKFIAFWRDDSGAAKTLVGTTTPVLGTAYVLTVAKIGGNVSMWVNGVLDATSTISLGATTVTSATVGATNRNAVSEYLNGKIYHLEVVKATLTETDRKLVEKLAANAAGIVL